MKSLLKWLLGLGILFFLGMVYWSNLLIENNLIELKSRVDALERRPFLKEAARQEKKEALPELKNNLLSVDPFYEKTLPALLGSDFAPHGELRLAIVARPKDLHPFTPWAEANAFRRMSSITLSTSHFGIYDSMGPALAIGLEERVDEETGRPEYWAFLRRDLYWQPLTAEMFEGRVELAPWFTRPHPVTAHDVKFFYDAMMNPFNQEAGAVALRTFYSDLESVEALDDYTLRIRWKTQDVGGVQKAKYMSRQLTGGLQALASFVYQYFANGEKILADGDFRTSSLFAQNFSNHFARNIIPSSGVWDFQMFTEKKIDFSRNEGYFEPLAALTNRRTVLFKGSLDGPWQEFKAGNIDLTSLTPGQLIELEQFLKSPLYLRQKEEGRGIERITYLARQFSYIGWNARKPFFQSAKVRKALTHAIDRKRIIETIFQGMGEELTGPLFVNSKEYNREITPLEFNPALAKQILEEEGWFDTDGDGIREKVIDGVVTPFRFALTYFVKSSDSKAFSEYIQTSLKEIGIDVRLNGLDLSDLSRETDDKSFDALFMAWALGTPPDDPRQLWYSTGADQKGSSNLVSFRNSEVDQIIDALDFEYDSEKRLELYHRFHRIIHEEQPYTFIHIPKATLVYRSYVNGVFIPADRQDLIPGADVSEPQTDGFWLTR